MSESTEKVDPFLTKMMVNEIDAGHRALDAYNDDLSAALSQYCIEMLDAADELAGDEDPENADPFNRGMAEAYARTVMALTGLLMAEGDRTGV